MQSQRLEAPSAAQQGERNSLLAGYGGEEEVPLGGYTILLGAFAGAFGVSLALVRKKLPRRYSLGDILLLSFGTHRIARTIAKGRVTSPVRAPFVRYEKPAGAGELSESSRGRGLQQAMGHLLTCPFCMAPWVGGALLIGSVTKPRITRAINVLATAVTIAGLLNHAIAAVKKH